MIRDDVLEQILLHGSPGTVGARLREVVARLEPDSIGLSLLTPNLERGLEDAAAALAVATSAPTNAVRPRAALAQEVPA